MSIAHALIIDDNANSALVLQQLLGMEGVTSQTLTIKPNLPALLDTITGVDVVFLDLEMPKINGYQVFDVIRHHPNFIETRIIAHSVHATEMDNAYAAQFDGFLGKPLDADAFPDQLARILRGESIWIIT